jgi:hypothetical protein
MHRELTLQPVYNTTYSAFEATKLKEQPEKAGKLLAQAQEATKAAGELNTYVEELKKN